MHAGIKSSLKLGLLCNSHYKAAKWDVVLQGASSPSGAFLTCNMLRLSHNMNMGGGRVGGRLHLTNEGGGVEQICQIKSHPPLSPKGSLEWIGMNTTLRAALRSSSSSAQRPPLLIFFIYIYIIILLLKKYWERGEIFRGG
nr:hypothetical protein [Morchella crassipes]